MTALTAAVSIGDTHLVIDTPFAAGKIPGWVKIDDEMLHAGGQHWRTGTTLTLSSPATAAHDSGATVTYAGRPYDADFRSATGGGVTVDNQADPPAEVTTLVAPGATISGDEATLTQQQMIAENGARVGQVTLDADATDATVISEVDDGAGKTARLELGTSGAFFDRTQGADSARVTVTPGAVQLLGTESPSSTSFTVHGADGLLLNDSPFTRGGAVADLAGGADLATTVSKVNELLAALRAAGLITT